MELLLPQWKLAIFRLMVCGYSGVIASISCPTTNFLKAVSYAEGNPKLYGLLGCRGEYQTDALL